MPAAVAALAAISLVGCSTTIRRIDPEWDGRSPPSCDDSYAPVIADALVGGLSLGVGAAASSKSDDASTAITLTGLAIGIALGISGFLGEEAVKDCRSATLIWRATPDAH